MSGPDDHGRPAAGFVLTTAVTGIATGASGVLVARLVSGPRSAVAGVVAGLIAGVPLSLWLSSRLRTRADGDRLEGGRRLRRRVHAVGWPAPVGASVVTVLAWAGVAHSSGSGWVQALGALLAAVLVTGLVAPWLPARRARLACVASPSDAVAGRPVELVLVASGPVRVRPLAPAGGDVRAAGAPRGPRDVTVTLVAEHRCVVGDVTVEIASSAPFGLLWWARDEVVPLPRPLHVAPRTGHAGTVRSSTDGSPGVASPPVPRSTGEPRGVREYRPGDPRRSVHWPATAHADTLMVREHEGPTGDPVVVEVDLPPDLRAAEQEAERVMAVVAGHLAGGRAVTLATTEVTGRVTRPVRDVVDLGRRLARAVPVHPHGPASRGDRWTR